MVQDLRQYQTVVVTCGASVQRGPHAANRCAAHAVRARCPQTCRGCSRAAPSARSFEEARARLAAAGDAALGLQRVVLLEGGYNSFKACPASAPHIEGAPRAA